jgi:hypothetical protein
MRARLRELNPSPNSGTNFADSVGKISSPYSARFSFKISNGLIVCGSVAHQRAASRLDTGAWEQQNERHMNRSPAHAEKPKKAISCRLNPVLWRNEVEISPLKSPVPAFETPWKFPLDPRSSPPNLS